MHLSCTCNSLLDLGLNTLDLKIEVLDVNDNTPQFISSTQLIGQYKLYYSPYYYTIVHTITL